MTLPALPEAPLRLDVASRSGRYPIHIAPGIARTLPALLAEAQVPPRRLIVSNPTVWGFHEHAFAGISEDDPILIPDGERFKHLQTVGKIYESLIRAGADRASAIVAVGGGVVGDVAGFAAATYLRGIPLVHVPTTLLAQVDSAVGGKVGVNHTLGKNMIGAFYPPAVVAIDPDLLATLPRREFRAGLYEVIKYGVIANRQLFDQVATALSPIFRKDPSVLLPVIAESCRIKAHVVQEDEREGGLRRILNFGHTVGHALESVTRYRRFRHGEAVAYGMLAATHIAVSRKTMPVEDRDALITLMTAMGPLPGVGDLPEAEILEAINRDKKVVNGRLHFVLPLGIGRCEVVPDVTPEEIAAALVEIGVS